MEKIIIEEYNLHFTAYEVQRRENPELIFLHQSNFVTYLPAHTVQPYDLVGQNGTLYVAPRYTVPES